MSEVCPAVTGRSQCEFFASTAHRCRRQPAHVDTETYLHRCECGYEWTCLTGSLDELLDLFKPPGGRP